MTGRRTIIFVIGVVLVVTVLVLSRQRIKPTPGNQISIPTVSGIPLSQADTKHLLANGIRQYAGGNYESASLIADVVLAKEPENTGALVLKALVLLNTGKKDQAKTLLERAVAINPSDNPAHELLSRKELWDTSAQR